MELQRFCNPGAGLCLDCCARGAGRAGRTGVVGEGEGERESVWRELLLVCRLPLLPSFSRLLA